MASRYWVGASAAWDTSTTTHWSTSSGGAGGASVPGVGDDVIFDAASGSVTITRTVGAGNCLSLNMSAFTGTLDFSTLTLNIYGALIIGTGCTLTGSTGTLAFQANSPTINSNGKTIPVKISLLGSDPNVVLQDALICSGALSLNNGTFNANNFNVTLDSFTTNDNSTTRTLTMGSGTWTLTGLGTSNIPFNIVSNTNFTFNANTSTIKMTDTSNTNLTFAGLSKTFNNVWWSRGTSTGDNLFTGSNIFNNLKDDGTGTHSLKFTNGTTTTFTSWSVSGVSGHLISINSDNTATHTLSCASGTVSADFLNVQHSVATGGATFIAGANSTNNQAVATAGSGWIFKFTTISDTVVDTDSAHGNWVVSVSDTVSDLDSTNFIKSRFWTTQTKHTSTWTNQHNDDK